MVLKSVDDEAAGRPPRAAACPVCQSKRLYYAFSIDGHRLERCADCCFMLLNPQPSDAELAAIYTDSYFLGDGSAESKQRVSDMKRATARRYLDEVQRYRGNTGGRLLEIGCGSGDLLLEAHSGGYEVTGVEISSAAAETARARVPDARVVCAQPDTVELPRGSFDVCMLCDVIEHVRDPLRVLEHLRELLKPDGVLYIATPALDSWSSRLLKNRWMEFKVEHLSLFRTATMQYLLYRAGFGQVVIGPGWKVLNLGYVADHFARYPVPVVSSLVQVVARLTPRPLRELNVPVVASGMAVCARPATVVGRPKLSVIVPAYNEAATFDALMRQLVKKELPGMDVEIIVVESNSNDGTRERALAYRDHPRVRLVLEDRPRGKGHAVRAGLDQATGDFILIQDADLEYDLHDYEALLEPLLHGRTMFVLGARHGGTAWKMRQFAGQRMLSGFFNLGHIFFTTLVNVLFGLRLKDPFTMYKVFRRDCLAGLTFACNRFDFDYELLVKLVRKGVRPLEVPVNYRSRSFGEGKKVSMIRDPLTWLWALVRLRLMKVDPLGDIAREQARRADSLSAREAA
jgi:SAM-dependent methyltransferase